MGSPWEALVRAGGWTAAVCVAAALLATLAGVRSVRDSWGATPSTSRYATAATAGLGLAALLVALGVSIGEARAAALSAVLLSSDALQTALAADALVAELLLGAVLVTMAGAPAVVGVVAPWAQTRGDRLLAVGLGLMAATGTVTALAYATQLAAGYAVLPDGDRFVVVPEILARCGVTVRVGAAVVAGLGVLTILGAGIAAGRSAVRPTLRSGIGPAALLLVGGVAFALTRDLAHDGDHPMPFLPRSADELPVPHDLPVVERCPDLVVGVEHAWLRIRPGTPPQLRVGGRRIPSSVALPRPPAAGHSRAVAIDAAATTPLTTLRPWLRSAQDLGYGTVLVFAQQVVRLETRTAGVRVRRVFCRVRFDLDPEAPAVAGDPSWEALARRAALGEKADSRGDHELLRAQRLRF